MIRVLPPVLLLVVLFLASLMLGARPGIQFSDLWALWPGHNADTAAEIVVRDLRLPRTLAGLLAGMALGSAGALIQTLTRNPIADPGLLGVNAGAALGIVLAIWLLGPMTPAARLAPAMFGAFTVLTLVWLIAAGARTPLTLILAGAAITGLAHAAVRGLILLDRASLDAYRDWSVGVLDQAEPNVIAASAWTVLPGLLLALTAARRLDSLALGDDMAAALGAGRAATRMLALAAIGLLSAAAVLVAGPIAFVGLVAPHLARPFAGQGTLSLMLGAGCLGAGLLLLADIAGRIVLPGLVVEPGLGVTIIGGAFLIALVRRQAGTAR